MAWNQDYGEGANPGSTREQQSWRDSYNGGQAAGDWTGNTNARLDSERDRFGTTWSGSSSEPSALELARSFVGRDDARGSGNWAGGNAAGTGAGNGAVRQVAPRTGSLTFSGSGAGNGGVVTGPRAAGPKNKVVKPGTANVGPWDEQFTNPDYQFDRGTFWTGIPRTDEVRGVPFPLGPFNFELSPLVPPAQVVEDNLGEGDVGSPAFFVNWAIAGEHIRWNVARGMESAGASFQKAWDTRNDVPIGYFGEGAR